MNPPSHSSLVDYYSACASEYDRIYLKPERQADLRKIEQWLPQQFVGINLLEIACGTGYWTRFLAPAVQTLLAVDASPETLNIAKQRTAAPHLRFVQGNAWQLQGLGQTFTGAFAGFWFSHVLIAERAAFLRLLESVLAPHSTIILLDNRFVPGSSQPIAERDHEGNTWQMRVLDDGSLHRVLKNFPSKNDLLALVAHSASHAEFIEWDYFWALRYVTRD